MSPSSGLGLIRSWHSMAPPITWGACIKRNGSLDGSISFRGRNLSDGQSDSGSFHPRKATGRILMRKKITAAGKVIWWAEAWLHRYHVMRSMVNTPPNEWQCNYMPITSSWKMFPIPISRRQPEQQTRQKQHHVSNSNKPETTGTADKTKTTSRCIRDIGMGALRT